MIENDISVVRSEQAQRWDKILNRVSCPACGIEISLAQISTFAEVYDVRHGEPVPCPNKRCEHFLEFWFFDKKTKELDRFFFDSTRYGNYALKICARNNNDEWILPDEETKKSWDKSIKEGNR